jgi:hypothetical protein
MKRALREQIAEQPPVRRASRYQMPTAPPNYYSAQTEPLYVVEEPKKSHFRGWFLFGLFLMLFGFVVWNAVVIPAWTNYQDQLHYGDARITLLLADVGHGGESMFIAFDSNGQVIVIELPGGSIDHARLYRTGEIVGDNADHRIITLSTQDVNGDGKPDLIIHVEGMSSSMVMYNTGNGFSWIPPK